MEFGPRLNLCETICSDKKDGQARVGPGIPGNDRFPRSELFTDRSIESTARVVRTHGDVGADLRVRPDNTVRANHAASQPICADYPIGSHNTVRTNYAAG